MRRCPFLAEYWQEKQGLLHVYHFDCQVDHLAKRKRSLRRSPPVCVRAFETCPLYQQELRRGDERVRRYTE